MDAPSAVLGLPAGSDQEEIERAYRERVKEAHPDQGGTVEEFRAVRTAYEQLLGGGPGPDGATDIDTSPTSPAGRSYAAATSQVRYLNYDVLGDYGWEVDDANLFGKAAAADLTETDYGQFRVDPGESLLDAAENHGRAWPFACRGGACANCAILLYEGELSMPANHVLPHEFVKRNIRLSCNGIPITDELAVVFNVKHMPEMDDLLLPPRPFKQAYPTD